MSRFAAAARGFTFIEIAVTLAIVSLMASAVLPLARLHAQREKEHELRVALRDIRTAIDRYKQAYDEGRIEKRSGESGYPPTLGALTDGVKDVKDIKNVQAGKLVFLRRIPRDPFAPDDLDDEATWAKRAYASSRDRPAEGDDVFDVYSKSEGTGLNGRPYREW
jgi:general secretion pathway protein G